MNLSTEPARLMALVHALLTAAAATGVVVADASWVQFTIAAVAIVGDWFAGQVVRDRVTPVEDPQDAYGNPLRPSPEASAAIELEQAAMLERDA